MAKINQIQNAIKELEGGAFQKLADSYLLRKGYPQINPIGSVAGSNKVRKVTPDTLIPTGDGRRWTPKTGQGAKLYVRLLKGGTDYGKN